MTTVDDTADRVPWLKWIDRFSILLAVLGGVATVGLMLNVVADVIGRYFFNHPFPGTLDLTQFAWMPTLVSLGLGYALLRGEHIRVNLLTGPTGPRTQRIIEIVGMVFTLGTTALFIWFGTEKAEDAMAFGEKAVGTPWLQIWPYRWVIVVGMVGLFLQAFAALLRAITVAEFKPTDEDETVAAIEAEETVFEELELEPATDGHERATTELEPATDGHERATTESESATDGRERATRAPEPATVGREPAMTERVETR
jgi:TRAP-type C4-dicarboxylate transport system permease small subunit